MPVTLRDTSVPAGLNQTTTTSTLVIPNLDVIPGALVLVFSAAERGALADIKTPTNSDGAMTEIGTGVSGSSGLFLRAHYRVITSTTSTTFSVSTIHQTAGSTQKSPYAAGFVFTDHDGIGNFATSTATPAPSVTPTNDDDMLIVASAFEDPGAETTPSGMTFRGSSEFAALGELVVFSQSLTSSAATGTKSTRASGSTVNFSIIVQAAQAPIATSNFFAFFGKV